MVRLWLLVSIRFQILFHSPSGVLFSFPSRYLYTIDQNVYLALPDSPGRFPQDFTSPVVLKNNNHDDVNIFRVQDFHLLWCDVPVTSTIYNVISSSVFWRKRHYCLTTPISRNDFNLSHPFTHRLASPCSQILHERGLSFSLFARHY